ncbi:hypothetical protein BDR26DRAFT_889936 [Obelidium mucronatum]|nr:hypothetical protein BDR26DRAFT_889936 [Obelidium mucronatum]
MVPTLLAPWSAYRSVSLLSLKSRPCRLRQRSHRSRCRPGWPGWSWCFIVAVAVARYVRHPESVVLASFEAPAFCHGVQWRRVPVVVEHSVDSSVSFTGRPKHLLMDMFEKSITPRTGDSMGTGQNLGTALAFLVSSHSTQNPLE